MAKYESICELIEKRIRLGDYALKELPAEERLASEVGVSRMTARRAVLRLVDKGLLVRKPNGRLVVNREPHAGKTQPQLALLTPAFISPQFERWQTSLELAASKMQARLRKVDFVHWEDPVIFETFDGFDGVFLLAGSKAMPETVRNRMRDSQTPLIVLDADWSEHGIRSIDHLYEFGHRRIACLNTQPMHDVIRERIDHVLAWQEERGLQGRLINEPVLPAMITIEKAYDVMKKFLQARQPDFTAMVATTMAPAIGAMRAFHEAGIRVGQDVSVCAVNDEGMGRYLTPTLTSTQMPDPAPFLEVGLEWMLQRGSGWTGSLLLQPANVSLFVGESTGACRATEKR
jgi:DNA-binding LacI/PurR family transcriptional regulator